MDTIPTIHPQVGLHIHLGVSLGALKKDALLALMPRAMPDPGDFLSPRPKAPLELGLWFCGRQKIRSLNRDHRGRDRFTDVLAFPLFCPPRIPLPRGPSPVNLGDIFICVPVAREQAASFGIGLEQEFIHLFVHGLLHLTGYDHEASPREERRMVSLEKKLVASIYQRMGWEVSDNSRKKEGTVRSGRNFYT